MLFVSKVETLDLPRHLPDLYDENLIEQTYDDLVLESQEIYLHPCRVPVSKLRLQKNLHGPKANQIFGLG